MWDEITESLCFLDLFDDKNPTAMIFGGLEYESLYVTSTSVNMSLYTVECRQPVVTLFTINGLGVKGVP